MPAHLISGGARSGKSAYAHKLALESGLPTIFIATARAGDGEMQARIEGHRRARPRDWQTIECGVELGTALRRASGAGSCVIVDCLTLWLASLLADGRDDDGPSAEQSALLELQRAELVAAVRAARGPVLIVTNELGCGVTPLGRLTRAFVEEHGLTNQRVAEACERLTLVVCGHPLPVKSEGLARE